MDEQRTRVAAERAGAAAVAVTASPASAGVPLDEGGLHQVIGYRLAQASVVANGVFTDAVGRPHELRPVEYTVLQLIACNPGSSPVQLARALSLTKASITMWVDRLVTRQLVRRGPSPTDGRAQRLDATAAGRRLAGAATERLLTAERQRLARLSDAELGMLVELLHKMTR